MAQFEQFSEIKAGDGKADIIIHQLNSHQLMQIMRIIDAHDLEYTFYDIDSFALDNDFNIRDMVFDLIEKNDSLPSFMQKLVTDMNDQYCDWDDDDIKATLEKAEGMEYSFVK